MKHTWFVTSGLALSCLAACQSMDSSKASALTVTPSTQVRHGASSPESLYAIGRYLQGQTRYDQAIAAYRRVLEIQPGHAEARNAIGLILASQGLHDAAITEFVIATTHAPSSASMRNNLGYAYLLQGRLAEAVATLEAARTIDPANQRVQDNLDIALTRRAEAAALAAAMAPTTADTPQEKLEPQPAPAVATPTPTPVVSVLPAAAATTPATTPAATPGAAPVVASGTPNPPPSTISSTDIIDAAIKPRLEISNANGIANLARDTSRQLTAAGYGNPRLTNQPPYQLPATQILYRPGFKPQAQALQATLRKGVPIAPSVALRADVQMRLVLGKDVLKVQDVVPPVNLAAQF